MFSLALIVSPAACRIPELLADDLGRKRGCALACPDQDLSCMQGKRLVLASTEQLHERITELEAALAQAHRTNANSSPHPLLKADHPDGGGAADASPHGRNSVKTETDEVRTLSPAQRSSSNGSYTLRTPVLQMDSIVERNQGRMAVESLLIDESQVGAEAKKEDDWAGENAAPALIVSCHPSRMRFWLMGRRLEMRVPYHKTRLIGKRFFIDCKV